MPRRDRDRDPEDILPEDEENVQDQSLDPPQTPPPGRQEEQRQDQRQGQQLEAISPMSWWSKNYMNVIYAAIVLIILVLVVVFIATRKSNSTSEDRGIKPSAGDVNKAAQQKDAEEGKQPLTAGKDSTNEALVAQQVGVKPVEIDVSADGKTIKVNFPLPKVNYRFIEEKNTGSIQGGVTVERLDVGNGVIIHRLVHDDPLGRERRALGNDLLLVDPDDPANGSFESYAEAAAKLVRGVGNNTRDIKQLQENVGSVKQDVQALKEGQQKIDGKLDALINASKSTTPAKPDTTVKTDPLPSKPTAPKTPTAPPADTSTPAAPPAPVAPAAPATPAPGK